MKKLILATGNPGKVREMKQILSGLYDEVISMKEAGVAVDVVEDADSFLGNAAKKALIGTYRGVKMHLISCDYLGFRPERVE